MQKESFEVEAEQEGERPKIMPKTRAMPKSR